MTDAGDNCHSCGEPVVAGDAFCEGCGSTLVPSPPNLTSAGAALVPDASAAGDGAGSHVPKTTFSAAPGAAGTCVECYSPVADDGFCSVCGKKAPSPRDHWQESPTDWVGGVCDKGIVHARNEDAMALAAVGDHSLAVLVVCDGVTSAPDSDRAALAAAREACAALVATPQATATGIAGIVSHWSAAIAGACSVANAAAVGVARSLGDPVEPPSCTFVAAVLDRDVVTVGWCGDSRAYWLPDAGAPEELTLDHSLGTEMMRAGKSRAEAEADPTFHTITRWLGADSVDATPDTASKTITEAGWLLVCSDGLWNYASPAVAVKALVHELFAAGAATPVELAGALVDWANEQGGHDNITAALARVEPSLR